MASTPQKPVFDSARIHRRETLLYIVLPAAGMGLLLLAGTAAVLLLPGRLQVSLIADLLLTVLVLCPMAVCLFPAVLVMIIVAFGMGKVHDGLARPLRRAETFSRSAADQVQRVTETINRQTADASARIAFLEPVLGTLDRPEKASPDQKDESHGQSAS